MGYTGNVTVGGAADVRQVAGLRVAKVAVGPMANNAYLLTCAATGEACLVDAADEPGVLLDLVGDVALRAVVTTHRHRDHWQGLATVVSATGAATYAGRDDVEGIPVPTEHPLDDGDVVAFGAVTLGVTTLVGHTPGSVALAYDDGGRVHLFTGDSLFPGGPGKTAGPPEFTSLMDDLERKVFGELGDETWVYPGHGRDTTLGAERPSLQEWRERGW